MKKVFYSPVESASPAWRYIGLFLRTLVSYFGIIGLCTFITSSAGLSNADLWSTVRITGSDVALLALPVALAMAVASLGKIWEIATPLASVGIYAGIIAAKFGDPVDFTVKSALRIYNMVLYRMSGLGYSSLGNYMVSDGYDYSAAGVSADPYRFGGVFLLCAVLGVFLYFTVQKKVRIIPLAIGMGIIIAPILTYNIARGTACIGFTVCFVGGVLGLKFYDRWYCGNLSEKLRRREEKAKRKKERENEKEHQRLEKEEILSRADNVYTTAAESEMGLKKAKAARRAVLKAHREAKKAEAKRKKAEEKAARKAAKLSADKKALRTEQKRRRAVSYMGGFAGAGSMAVILLAIIIPMSTVSGNFKIIDSINNKVQIVRTYVTAYLKGNDIDLNELYAYGVDDLAPRRLTFDPVTYRDKKLFRVESVTDNNVYLRSWIGTKFDYLTEEWSSADTDTVLLYRDSFGENFTPDEISDNFYKYVFPSVSEFEGDNVYKNFGSFGFNVQKVNVWRVSGKSLLLFVPAHMNTDVGLTAYGSMEDAEYKYSRYYEGVYSSRFYKYGTGYGTVSYVTAFNRAGSGDGLEDSVRYWNASKKFITENKDSALSPESLATALYSFDMEMEREGIEYPGVSLPERYFTTMTEDEKAELLRAFDLEEKYKAYALENYTERSGSMTVAAIAEEIKGKAAIGADGDVTENDLVRAVVDRFRSDYTFTLTPDGSDYTGDKTVLEAFLTDVKEGYSTHFATAAAAILREYSIPVRYVEGLVAKDFEEARGEVSPYRAQLFDSNASSWIEVYMDGVGWVQYEVCPGELSDAMYDPKSNTMTEEELAGQGGEDDSPFPEDKHESVMDIINRLGSKDEEPKETDLQWFIRRAVPAAVVIIILLIIFFILRYVYRSAHKALGERFAVIGKVQDPENAKRDDYSAMTREIDALIIEVFDLIGEGPEKGELPADFAARLSRDFSDLSNIDPAEIFGYMEKAEFGHGITFDEADRCAEYLKDIADGVYRKLKFTQKIKLRYLKRKL